jgi:hypothetical protein
LSSTSANPGFLFDQRHVALRNANTKCKGIYYPLMIYK